MAQIESVRLEGISALAARLREFPRKIQRRALYSMLHRAGVPIRDEARRLAHGHGLILKTPDPRRRPGTLIRHIRSMSRRAFGRYAAVVGLGVPKLSSARIRAFKQRTGRGGANNPDDPFYWRFWEFGHHDAKGRFRRKSFLRPAFETKKVMAAQAAQPGLRAALDEALGKLGRQGFTARMSCRMEAFLGL